MHHPNVGDGATVQVENLKRGTLFERSHVGIAGARPSKVEFLQLGKLCQTPQSLAADIGVA